jgi:hypothetical protein
MSKQFKGCLELLKDEDTMNEIKSTPNSDNIPLIRDFNRNLKFYNSYCEYMETGREQWPLSELFTEFLLFCAFYAEYSPLNVRNIKNSLVKYQLQKYSYTVSKQMKELLASTMKKINEHSPNRVPNRYGLNPCIWVDLVRMLGLVPETWLYRRRTVSFVLTLFYTCARPISILSLKICDITRINIGKDNIIQEICFNITVTKSEGNNTSQTVSVNRNSSPKSMDVFSVLDEYLLKQHKISLQTIYSCLMSKCESSENYDKIKYDIIWPFERATLASSFNEICGNAGYSEHFFSLYS